MKTDSIDAATLDHLLRSNLVPSSYIPSLEEQDHREISRPRCNLVKQRTHVKNKTRAILGKANLNFDGSDLFGKKGRQWLQQQDLHESRQIVVDEYLQLLDEINQRIDRLDQVIEERSQGNREVEILKSIPGFGQLTAFLLAAEIGDVSRFADGTKLASYLGLVPRVYRSGKTNRHGRITKVGNPYARWCLVQAAHRVARSDEPFKTTYRKLSERRGKKKAIVAVARKLATLCWRLLIENREYESEPPGRVRSRYST